MKKIATKKKSVEAITIAAPNFQQMEIKIIGTAPLVQHRFSQKIVRQMLEAHVAGDANKNKSKKKVSRDIQQDYKDATHLGDDGHYGIPASAFRSAMISACRVAGFQMTKARLSVFVEADTLDNEDGQPLVHLEGEPILHKSAVRLANGVASVAIRPMFKEWSAVVRAKWDGDQFTSTDVVHLMMRAGLQVGIGEGRPDSKKSNGMGWGTFRVATEGE